MFGVFPRNPTGPVPKNFPDEKRTRRARKRIHIVKRKFGYYDPADGDDRRSKHRRNDAASAESAPSAARSCSSQQSVANGLGTGTTRVSRGEALHSAMAQSKNRDIQAGLNNASSLDAANTQNMEREHDIPAPLQNRDNERSLPRTHTHLQSQTYSSENLSIQRSPSSSATPGPSTQSSQNNLVSGSLSSGPLPNVPLTVKEYEHIIHLLQQQKAWIDGNEINVVPEKDKVLSPEDHLRCAIRGIANLDGTDRHQEDTLLATVRDMIAGLAKALAPCEI